MNVELSVELNKNKMNAIVYYIHTNYILSKLYHELISLVGEQQLKCSPPKVAF